MTVVTEALRSPYKGLSAFDESELDALLFFGRESETEIVAANALASRLTVLYGPSGVGKSSLLRAGVVRVAARALGDGAPRASHISAPGPATLSLRSKRRLAARSQMRSEAIRATHPATSPTASMPGPRPSGASCC